MKIQKNAKTSKLILKKILFCKKISFCIILNIIYNKFMKIFNNFDTNTKKREIDAAIKRFWKENIYPLERNVFYFLINWLIPFTLFSIFAFAVYLLAFSLQESTYLFWVIFIWISVISIVLFYKVFNIFIDYKYDFSIITPRWIFTYKQKWLFNSDFKDLPAEKIRSIIATRNWILGNIFWYWTVEIYTDLSLWSEKREAWRSQAWKTKISYVYKPAEVRQRILNICVISSDD